MSALHREFVKTDRAISKSLSKRDETHEFRTAP